MHFANYSPGLRCVLWTGLAVAICAVLASTAQGELRVGEICRVKGETRSTLQGMGLVVGLKGSGDGEFNPTTRSLVQAMINMGVTLPQGLAEDAKNVALVYVTATVPGQGAEAVTSSIARSAP